jgi:hypothetical protein
MSDNLFSRRRLLGDATLAAVTTAGLAALSNQTAHATPTASQEQRPRLPLRILLKRKLLNDDHQKLAVISPQITVLGPDRFENELPTAESCTENCFLT